MMPIDQVVTCIQTTENKEKLRLVLQATQARLDELEHKDQYGAGAGSRGQWQNVGTDISANPGSS